MKKDRLYLVFTISMIVLIGAVMSYVSNPSYQVNPDVWWNNTWNYRVKLDINSSYYDRTDWPIEYDVNFTDFLSDLNKYQTLNISSIRVFEYNSAGDIIYEVPYQFDQDENYDATNNARATLIFFMNGTTSANTKRHYYIYYDTVENGVKPNVTYSSGLTYNHSGDQFHVNTSEESFYIDTSRGENVSGIYKITGMREPYNDIFLTVGENENTIEYLKYSNGTHNFTFDLANNYTFTTGPMRITVEQKGYEVIWNSSNATSEGFITKKYYFYRGLGWIKIEQNFTNIAPYDIVRNSSSGNPVLNFDAERGLGSGYQTYGNSTEPFSWYWARDNTGTYHVGVININQTGTSNFYTTDGTSSGKIGVSLNSTTIIPGTSVIQTSVIHVNDTQADPNQVSDLRNRFQRPIEITQSSPEIIKVDLSPTTNYTIYNRNETIVLFGNASYDPYNITAFANVTIDLGTVSTADDVELQLYDDGTHFDSTAIDDVFTNAFNLTNISQIGTWEANLTVYDQNLVFLNSTTFTFDVTDILVVNTSVVNPLGLIDRVVNVSIDVRNFRQDTLLPNAIVNCSYSGIDIENITDYANGTYLATFVASSSTGNYTINCTANRTGNFGWEIDTFVTETAVTYSNISLDPSNYTSTNVTLYQNETFVFVANISNTGNGTMSNSNVTLTLPSLWSANITFESCNSISPSSYCLKPFLITIPDTTIPDNYTIDVNVTWKNPGGTLSSNQTSMNVSVLSNPRVNINETSLSNTIGDGLEKNIGNFTIISEGNDNITNINFTTSGFPSGFNFTFTPNTIGTLGMSYYEVINLNVSVPLNQEPGVYSGTINASAENNGFDILNLNITVLNFTYMNITTNPASFSALNVSQSDNQSFNLSVISSNIGEAIARSVNFTLVLPTNWISNSSLEQCDNISISEQCSKGFLITIPNATTLGNYTIYANVTWRNPDSTLSTNQTTMNISVLSNPQMETLENYISGNSLDGVEDTIANFTVTSIGNANVTNITFYVTGLDDFNISLSPSNISLLSPDSNQIVYVNASIPLGYSTGNYNGTINVTTGNDGSKNLTLEVFVLQNRTWQMNTTICEKVSSPNIGTACEVIISNVGNAVINFTISPENGNYTQVNATNFTVSSNENLTFNVTYDVTGVSDLLHFSLFTVNATQYGSNPDYRILNVTLLPLAIPIIVPWVSPNKTEQLDTVNIWVNVTDKTNQGINWVRVNVTRPSGTVDTFSMSQFSLNGNFSMWNLVYPNSTGNTSERGEYSVQVFVRDVIGNAGDENTTFKIYSKLLTYLTTLKNNYYQGDSASIYYRVRNLTGDGLNRVNVTFEVKDPYQNLTYIENKTTSSSGIVTLLPTFEITSDATVGTYTLWGNATYYDDIVNESVYKQDNYTFTIIEKVIAINGLFTDLETSVAWYPDDIMKFGLLVYDGEGRPVDPEFINLTIYSEDEHVFLNVLKAALTRETTGYYSYKYDMPDTTASGMYLAHLNVTNGQFTTQTLKAFRVSRGGLYDVRVNLVNEEVYPGEYLDFEIIIENKGETSQDVTLSYWVSTSGTNDTWYSKSEDVYTPAYYNQSFTRQAYIFSNQPTGDYFINLQVTYDTVMPPKLVNSSFTVIPATNVTTTTVAPSVVVGGGGGGGFPATEVAHEKWKDAPKKVGSIVIVDYRPDIILSQGWNSTVPVSVKNTGQIELEDVELVILGIPVSWYEIRPRVFDNIGISNTSIFIVEFTVPKDSQAGEYDIILSVLSGEISDKKSMKMTVYRSVEELLKDQINKLKIELEKLKSEIEVARKSGKDVEDVGLFIEEIEIQLRLGEQNLAASKYDEGLKNVEIARNLIERARSLLYGLLLIREKISPLVIIVPVFLILIIIGIILFIILTKKKKKKVLFSGIEKLTETLKVPKIQDENLVKEKEKLGRMLDLLEQEKREKIITKSAYKELKKNVQRKLDKVNKKLEKQK